jgi:hypothetical protein
VEWCGITFVKRNGELAFVQGIMGVSSVISLGPLTTKKWNSDDHHALGTRDVKVAFSEQSTPRPSFHDRHAVRILEIKVVISLELSIPRRG